MHDRQLIPRRPSPVLLTANPCRVTPLIRELPDSLKPYVCKFRADLGLLRRGDCSQDLSSLGVRLPKNRLTMWDLSGEKQKQATAPPCL